MGLSRRSTWLGALKETFHNSLPSTDEPVVALAGNPNTGKSTVFNAITGLRQHTGNWPGKTVAGARGKFCYHDRSFILVDLPGTYSLLAGSIEEEIARDFICFGRPHATVVVADATCLERNLNLVLQILEMTPKVVVCVNLMDEARRKKITIDLPKLSNLLGVPVVGTNARGGEGIKELLEAVYNVATGKIETRPLRITYEPWLEKEIDLLEQALQRTLDRDIGSNLSCRWLAIRILDGEEKVLQSLRQHLRIELPPGGNRPNHVADSIVSSIMCLVEKIKSAVVTEENTAGTPHGADNVLTSKIWGIPIMLALLGLVFWITIAGANYPSAILATFFFHFEERLSALFIAAAWPDWLHGLLVRGMFKTLGWVVSVMLPPMAVFFPLFTMLEDVGYLPRVAFNLDNFFRKACAHGKQVLTMCMGFGCNAAGVISCRIIDSPREKLIAVITNNFVPCNGRFPTLVSLAAIFIAGTAGGALRSLAAAAAILAAVILGVTITLAVSRLLSRTILKGLPSSFALELPPSRKPLIGLILIRSLLDRTLFVLGRAVMVAAPAGLVIWFTANTMIAGRSLLDHGAALLQPLGRLLGMDGYILMAFILGFPANEIVIPIVIMSYLSTGSMLEPATLKDLHTLLAANGWNWLTAVCTMLFMLNHFPCATTLLTIRQETQSLRWTLVAFLVPTLTGMLLCFTVAQAARLLGLV